MISTDSETRSLSQSQDRVPSTSIGQPDTSSNGNLAALEESALQGSPEATLNATEPVDQEGITLEGVDLAPKTGKASMLPV